MTVILPAVHSSIRSAARATILCEAAQLFPDLEIVGGDLSQEAVNGARRNMRAAALDERAQISCGDALEMSTTYADRRIGTIVTNPPYGVRLSRHLHFFDFYRKFLEQCALLLERGNDSYSLPGNGVSSIAPTSA